MTGCRRPFGRRHRSLRHEVLRRIPGLTVRPTAFPELRVRSSDDLVEALDDPLYILVARPAEPVANPLDREGPDLTDLDPRSDGQPLRLAGQG